VFYKLSEEKWASLGVNVSKKCI